MPEPTRRSTRRASVVLLAVGLSAAPAAAQAPTPRPDSVTRTAPDSLSADSLAARLARTEAAIALLRQQLAEQAESGARLRSRARFELSATVLTNAFYTSTRVNNVDVPQVVLPPTATGDDGGALGASVRQTRVGAAASMDDVLGAAFDASVDLDFFGGVQSGPGDRRLFPEPRLRVARARLVWARTELLVGSETPLVSDLDPVSVAAVGTPDFSGAGNLWNWLPQVRVSRELGAGVDAHAAPGSERRLRVAVQAAVLAPFTNAQGAGEPDATDAAERSRRPFLEGRVRARWGAASAEHDLPGLGTILDGGGEIGVGVHRGWVDVGGGAIRSSRAVTADARVVLARHVELRGEGYVGGRLVRGLGGGAIGQTFGRVPAGAPAGTIGAPLSDAGGWAQLNWRPHPVLLTGAGCGYNAVDPAGRPLRRSNLACATHLTWRPMEPLLLGLEYRRLRTRYDAGPFVGHHLNLALGVEL
jgi:hypothetical protein